MMDHMTGGMIWGMGIIGVLVLVLLVLGVAALTKYLLFQPKALNATRSSFRAKTPGSARDAIAPRLSNAADDTGCRAPNQGTASRHRRSRRIAGRW
jgi:hypothetical protein